MSDDLYRLIPEEGKHLAESHDTEGAFRGVYLDDETNKPSGAGEFVKVDLDDLIDRDDDPSSDSPSDASGNAAGVAALIGIGIGAGIAIHAAYPHVKRWAKETAIPSVKRLWAKVWKKDSEDTVALPNSTDALPGDAGTTEVSIDVAYNEYRENMSSEEAQRELIEAFILHLESMRKVKRVANANVVDSDGRLSDGKAFLETVTSSGMLESVNDILRKNPALIDQKQKRLLAEILGYQMEAEKEFIPITTDMLIEGLAMGEAN